MRAIVYDLGGTFLRCGVVAADGGLISCVKRPITCFLQNNNPQEVADGVMRQMLEYLGQVQGQLDRGAPMVISFPGPIRNRREIVNAPSVTGALDRFPDLARRLEDASGRRVYLLNDLSAAARYFATTGGADRFLVVSISSGIGSKVYDRNHPSRVLDDVPYAGEIGHWTVVVGEDAPLCDCGAPGHLGAVASGRGIERAARRRARENPEMFQGSACATRYAATAENLSNEAHLVPAARLGDPWAIGTIRECTAYLAQSLLGAILTVGLQEVIVIGGFPMALGEMYLAILREEMGRFSNYTVLGATAPSLIRLGAEAPEACLAGAAEYARTLGVDSP